MRNPHTLINDVALRGYVALQTSVGGRLERSADNGHVNRYAVGVGTITGTLMAAGVAVAVPANCTTNKGLGGLTDFIGSAANFAIGLGAAGALLMLAIGALLIIFGGTPDRVGKGMKIIKNSVIGLALLAAGFFIKYIVLEFVSGATSSTGGLSSKDCLNQGGTGGAPTF